MEDIVSPIPTPSDPTATSDLAKELHLNSDSDLDTFPDDEEQELEEEEDSESDSDSDHGDLPRKPLPGAEDEEEEPDDNTRRPTFASSTSALNPQTQLFPPERPRPCVLPPFPPLSSDSGRRRRVACGPRPSSGSHANASTSRDSASPPSGSRPPASLPSRPPPPRPPSPSLTTQRPGPPRHLVLPPLLPHPQAQPPTARASPPPSPSPSSLPPHPLSPTATVPPSSSLHTNSTQLWPPPPLHLLPVPPSLSEALHSPHQTQATATARRAYTFLPTTHRHVRGNQPHSQLPLFPTQLFKWRRAHSSKIPLEDMSSLRNAISRRAHKERAQPHDRAKFGILEKHKDYIVRAKAYHKKEETLRKLKEKAAFKNPDEFYFNMINSRVVDGVHRPKSEGSKYSPEELMIMKTQDIGYVLQKIQSEKKKIERLGANLHSLSKKAPNKHVYFAEDREEARELESRPPEKKAFSFAHVSKYVKRKTASSYKELEARKARVQELEKVYMDMSIQMELRKKGRKRKLREDELAAPTTKPVYKWRAERKR